MLKVAAREVFDVGVFCDLFGSIVVWGLVFNREHACACPFKSTLLRARLSPVHMKHDIS